MSSDLALLSTLIGSNYPCLELIFMVPKVFEPLKFDCSSDILESLHSSSGVPLKPVLTCRLDVGSVTTLHRLNYTESCSFRPCFKNPTKALPPKFSVLAVETQTVFKCKFIKS